VRLTRDFQWVICDGVKMLVVHSTEGERVSATDCTKAMSLFGERSIAEVTQTETVHRQRC